MSLSRCDAINMLNCSVFLSIDISYGILGEVWTYLDAAS